MTTLVIGASINPERYSHKAVLALQRKGLTCIAYGKQIGKIGDVDITTSLPRADTIDTITLYISPKNQVSLELPLLELRPRRIIFNPGTENPTLIKMAKEVGIITEIACTLVLLSTDTYA